MNYTLKNHSSNKFSKYVAAHLSIASMAGGQRLHFCTGRMLTAVMKHAKNFLLSYSKGRVSASLTYCGETE